MLAFVFFRARILWRRFLHKDFDTLLDCTNFRPASQSSLSLTIDHSPHGSLLHASFLPQGLQVYSDSQDLGLRRSRELRRQRADHLYRGLHHKPCLGSSYFDTSNALSLATENLVETQAPHHDSVRGRGSVGSPSCGRSSLVLAFTPYGADFI